jgi:thioredoxin reductase
MMDRGVAIVGAGPYGLSIAAHLQRTGVSFRIFGRPMQTWREHMPNGMLLKSDGFASSLADPASKFTLEHFCESADIPYDDTKIPIRLETFREYGLAFQQCMVPEVEDTQVVRIERRVADFRLHLSDGRHATTQRVVLAVGVSHFHVLPAVLKHLPAELVTHSSAHTDLERFRGRDVTVVGAGASAIDLAVLLRDAGADVVLVARRVALRFNDPPVPHRSLWVKLRYPSSPIGPGWRSFLYANAPWLFYRLPATMRRRIMRTTLAPAAGWPMKDRFEARIPLLLGRDIEKAEAHQNRVRLTLTGRDGRMEHDADHVIAATGYEVDLRRLTFLSPEILSDIQVVDQAPVLSPCFETSVPGLYIVGFASKYSFGPVMQFACGAPWTAARISRHLARAHVHRRRAGATPRGDVESATRLWITGGRE